MNQSKKITYESLIYKIPFYGVIFFVPLYRWRHILPIPIDWLLVIFILVIVSLRIIVQKRLPIERLTSNLNPLYLLFLIANLISYILTSYPISALEGIRILFFGYVFIALTQIIISESDFSIYLPVVLGISVGLSSFLAILGGFFQVEMFSRGLITGGVERGVGGTIGANNMCIMNVYTLPLVAFWFMHSRTLMSKIISLSLLPILIFGIISTYSRGGFLHFILVLLLIAYYNIHRFHPRYLGLVISLAGITLLTIISLTPDTFFFS